MATKPKKPVTKKLPTAEEIKKMDPLEVYRMMKKRQTTTMPLRKPTKMKTQPKATTTPLPKGIKPWVTKGGKKRKFMEGTRIAKEKHEKQLKKILKKT